MRAEDGTDRSLVLDAVSVAHLSAGAAGGVAQIDRYVFTARGRIDVAGRGLVGQRFGVIGFEPADCRLRAPGSGRNHGVVHQLVQLSEQPVASGAASEVDRAAVALPPAGTD